MNMYGIFGSENLTEPTGIFHIRLRGSQVLLGYPKCNRSDVGRKSDIGGGISTLPGKRKEVVRQKVEG